MKSSEQIKTTKQVNTSTWIAGVLLKVKIASGTPACKTDQLLFVTDKELQNILEEACKKVILLCD